MAASYTQRVLLENLKRYGTHIEQKTPRIIYGNNMQPHIELSPEKKRETCYDVVCGEK